VTTLGRLENWKNSGTIREDQFKKISALVRKVRFSVFLELNVLLYLGVLSFVAGAGWTVRTYFSNLGDAAIITSLTFLVGTSFYYCFSRVKPYSNLQVESPNLGFDYILYLGCLLLAVELGYLETRFHLLDSQWDYYLLVSALAFFAGAYRFDNRFVLSLALSTLAAWFGIRTFRLELITVSAVRLSAIVYAGITFGAGLWLHQANIKKHFLETYLHIATNVLLAALVSGVGQNASSWYLPASLAAAALSFWGGVRYRRFAFVAYGVLYGYIVVSVEVLKASHSFTSVLAYFFLSGAVVVLGMILLARRIGRES
jgi:Predicted membrane protein (DUF2157)